MKRTYPIGRCPGCSSSSAATYDELNPCDACPRCGVWASQRIAGFTADSRRSVWRYRCLGRCHCLAARIYVRLPARHILRGMSRQRVLAPLIGRR